MLRLPYGRAPYPLDLDAARVTLLEARALEEPRPLDDILNRALDAPLDSPALETLAQHAKRVTIIVSDHTRHEPREAFLRALERRLPSTVSWTIAIATGTHGPSPLAPLGIESFLRRARLVNHDGVSGDPERRDDLVAVGTTSSGTPIRVHRCVVETDLVIATGCIRPHYFAGFGAGAKAIFPGLGDAVAIRINHRLKTEPLARAGVVDGNPCRGDLEEAVARLAAPTFLLNGIVGADEHVHAAVAGNVFSAFRAGAMVARDWFSVRARPSDVVIASDGLPVTASLYQAAKIAAAVAPVVKSGGRLILVAECPDGVGPLRVVNEAIFDLGVLPRLATGVSLELVSCLSDDLVRQTRLRPSHGIAVDASNSIIVIPRASHLLVETLP